LTEAPAPLLPPFCPYPHAADGYPSARRLLSLTPPTDVPQLADWYPSRRWTQTAAVL